MPILSVIIPVYKTELYLEKCVNSVLSQPIDDLEVILVDDCSPDNSGALCDELAARDSRVRVLHKAKNEGLGFARRDGLNAAKGEWVCYLDSDDWYEENALAEAVKKVDDDSDIICFGLKMIYENAEGQAVNTEEHTPQRASAKDAAQLADTFAMLEGNGVFQYMVNKLYRTEFVKNAGVEFNTIQSMEDFFYNIEIFDKVRKLEVYPSSFYCYRKPQRETLASAYNPQFFELSKRRYKAEREFLLSRGAKGTEAEQIIFKSYVKHLIFCLLRDAQPSAKMKRKERKIKAKQYLSDETSAFVFSNYHPESAKFGLIVKLLKSGNSSLAVMLGDAVFLAQTRFAKLYNKVLKR